MTIKQQGGIFGRNPTFNDVEVDSTLKTDGIRYDPTQDGGYGGSVFVRGGTAIGGLQGQLFGGIAFGSSDRISTAAIAAAQTGSNNDNVGLAFYTHSTNPQNDAAIKAFDVTHTGNIAFPSGQGIDFSATSGTGTSELFSDYEEGSWTPTFTTSGTDFNSITYDAITGGLYTKIGNMVHIQATIRTDSVTVGSASGSLFIGGLPYTSVADTGSKQDSRAPLSVANVINFATNQPSSARIVENSTNIVLYYRTSSNGVDTTAQYTELNTGANQNLLRIAGSYIAS